MGGAKGEKEGGGGGGGGGEKKKDDGSITVVLKVDMHCEGCALKVKRSVKGFEGVERVSTDLASNKLTVVGKVDPWKIRDRVEAKTRKKVDLISPTNPPKPKDGGGGGGGGGGDAKKPAGGGGGGGDSKDAKKPAEDKKPKAPQVSTVVLKIRLHCAGCIQRIRKTILKMKGVQEVSIDDGKDLVTVKGTMDVKALPEILKDKLKRSVEVVPDKKGGDGGGGGGGDKKGGDGGGEKKKDGGGGGGGGEKKEGGGGGEKKEGGGGEKKKEGGGGGGGGGEKDDGGKAAAAAVPVAEVNKMEYYGPYGYRIEMAHPPQYFSDENPNACSIM